MTYRETLEGLLERSRNPERRAHYESELECPPLPLELQHIWRAFQRLARRRSSSGFGVNPISWGDIDAFCRFNSSTFTPWEIQLIEDLDEIYLAEQSRTLKNKTQKPGSAK